ncbi:MAG: hypothetical protein KGP29_05020 [Proteobacteria bacterium]|nr:hypothetical protein [Pseudomonadota bacterium]
MTLDATSLLQAHPALVQEIAGHALGHVLYGHVRRIVRRKGLSRRGMRKLANRKRRRFVDNIIMHHKRLHDKNRQSIISNARTRALARRNQNKKDEPSLAKSSESGREDLKAKYSTSSLKERGAKLRGHVDARRIRARSRWLTVMQANG